LQHSAAIAIIAAALHHRTIHYFIIMNRYHTSRAKWGITPAPLIIIIALVLAGCATARGQVVIGEIMFDPVELGGEPGAEYVELHNRAAVAVEVAGWKLYDAARPQATIGQSTLPIAPGGYLVIASDSAIYRRFPYLRDSSNVIVIGKSSFALNADEDELMLRSADGAMIDSVHYLDDWHRRDLGEMKGVAIERISMSGPPDAWNWSSSAAPLGGTPGARNSVDIPAIASEGAVAIIPPIFSPDGDGREDFTRVGFRLPLRIARIVAVAYDRHGRPVRRLASNELAAAAGELIWDGRDDDGHALEPGIYLVRVEGYDEGRGSFAVQGTVVIARRL
jgi:Lamin Tail Domain/FlgD Ig-like domain